MPFEKGRPKTGGRKPGVQNKRTIAMNQFLDKIMENIETHVAANPDAMIDEMGVQRMLEMYRDLLQYYKPRLATLKVDETSKKTINININGSK